jgi:hypothetical protein
MVPTNSSPAGSPVILIAPLLVGLIVSLIVIAGMWKMFAKAGKPGWAAIIPFYNLYVLFEITQSPTWFFWGYLGFSVIAIPTFGLGFIGAMVLFIIAMLSLARQFAKSDGFAVGLILLSPIFFCILGFGDAQYRPVLNRGPDPGGYPPYGATGYPPQGAAYPTPPMNPGTYQTPAPPAPVSAPYTVTPQDPTPTTSPWGASPEPSPWAATPAVPAASPWGPTPPVAPVAPAPSAPAGPVAGWYNVNDDSAQRAYWDGTAWSSHQHWDGSTWAAS